MITIGKKPNFYYTNEQLDTMKMWELAQIVEENGWQDLFGDNLKYYEIKDVLPMIKSKMNEWRMKVDNSKVLWLPKHVEPN